MATSIEPTPQSVSRGIAAATMGSALEWYDVLIYAYVAPEIGHAFFPNEAPMVSTAIALGSFGVSYLARPLGGLVLGRYADRAGRRAGLVLVSKLMFLATAIICFLPGYDAIGLTGPVLLFAARLLQGFSAGGEFGSGIAYLAEQRPDRRAFFTSWQFASQGFAVMLAAGVTALVSITTTPEQMAEWGWRIPFALGLVIGPVAYYIRAHAGETAEFLVSQREPSRPCIVWRDIALGTGMVALATAIFYSLVYLPTLGTTSLGLSKTAAQGCSILGGLILLVATPCFGVLSDSKGHGRVAKASAATMVVVAVPVFGLLDLAPNVAGLAVAQALIALVGASYLAALSPSLTDLFPTRNRTLGISIAYNVAVLTVGGFAPLGLSMLTELSSHHLALGVYPGTMALIALSCLIIRSRPA
jgi:MHS family proline/betaine transporter-like MFS transporter